MSNRAWKLGAGFLFLFVLAGVSPSNVGAQGMNPYYARQLAFTRMAMASRSHYPTPVPSCHPTRYGYSQPNTWSNPYQNELARTEAYYEKKRIRQRYLDEQRQRKLYTAEDALALREHRESLQEMLEIKREMARDRNRSTQPAAGDGLPAGRTVRLAAVAGPVAFEASFNSPSRPPTPSPVVRTWVSADCMHHVEAELMRCRNNGVTLRRADSGAIVHVPLSDLHPVSQREAITGLPWGRTWRDKSGSHCVLAELVSCQRAHIMLQKPDGSLLSVPLSELSSADQRHVAVADPHGSPDSFDQYCLSGPVDSFGDR